MGHGLEPVDTCGSRHSHLTLAGIGWGLCMWAPLLTPGPLPGHGRRVGCRTPGQHPLPPTKPAGHSGPRGMPGEIIHGHLGQASVLGLGRPLLPTGASCRCPTPTPSLVQGLSPEAEAPRGRWSICIEVGEPRGRPWTETSEQAWVSSGVFHVLGSSCSALCSVLGYFTTASGVISPQH